jgi:hypothetical protein
MTDKKEDNVADKKDNVHNAESFEFDKVIKKVDATNLTSDKLFEEILKSDDTLPWCNAYLPSRGMFYSPDSPVPTPLIPDGLVQIRPMGLDIEKLTSTPRYQGKFVELMIEKCVRFPDGFNQADLLVGDRLFLLFYIRGITYGNKYQFALKCPGCDKTGIHDYDLNELARTIKSADPDIVSEPFKIKLPYLSEKYGKDVMVKARFMRGRDQNVMSQRASFKKKVMTIKPKLASDKPNDEQVDVTDESVIEKFCLLITEVLGVSDPYKIKQFVESKLHSLDAAAINVYLEEKCPSMSAEIRVTCGNCGQEVDTTLPITARFFRPQVPGGDGA